MIIIYTTAGCHLCEQAEQLLESYVKENPLPWQAKDIALDPALVERYGLRIPVLMLSESGRELGWPFDVHDLRRFLEGA